MTAEPSWNEVRRYNEFLFYRTIFRLWEDLGIDPADRAGVLGMNLTYFSLNDRPQYHQHAEGAD